jgi:hypothetical protein
VVTAAAGKGREEVLDARFSSAVAFYSYFLMLRRSMVWQMKE